MSSFRPDSETASPGFVPHAIEGFAGFCAIGSTQQAAREVERSDLGEVEAPRALEVQAPTKTPEPAAQYTAEELEAAEQAGFERGSRSVDAARQEFERAAAALEGSAAELRTSIETRWNDWIAGEREAVIELASLIAEQWVRGTLRSDPDTFTAMLDAALADVADSEPERIYLSAADLDRLKRERSETGRAWEPAEGLDLECDARLESGEFRIALRRGWVDGRFDQIRRSLREHWSEFGSGAATPATDPTAEDGA